MYCSKCNQSFYRLALMALLQDAGARCSPGSNVCPADGGEHEFVEPKGVPDVPKA
jgi:hypothetical protein